MGLILNIILTATPLQADPFSEYESHGFQLKLEFV